MTLPSDKLPGRVVCPAAEANAQYDLRAAFPDYPQVLETWRAATQQVHAARQPRCDLKYGREALQDLDYFSCGRANAPLLIFVHGGYWQGGDKNDVGFIVEPFVAAGADAAVINYRLAPQARIEDMVEDVLLALRFLLRQQAEGRFAFDPARIAWMGHSAGGHLVATVASRLRTGDLPKAAQVFAISGVFDLPPLLPTRVNQALQLDLARAEALSPVRMPAPDDTEVHTLIGEHETDQFHVQSRALAEVWPQQVVAHHVIPKTHHFTVLNALADPAQPAVRAMIAALSL